MCWDALLSRNPLVRKYHGSPTVGVAIFLQTAKSWKWQVRTCNENVLHSKDRQQLRPCGHCRSRIDVENCGNLGMFQLGARGMYNIAPK